MKLTKVHEDSRGEISALTEFPEFEELTFLFTRQGKARGGCIHQRNNEYFCVISGRVEITIGDSTFILKTGETTFIPKNSPHYFIAIEDSLVCEWGATAEEKKEKHSQYRKIVKDINRGVYDSFND